MRMRGFTLIEMLITVSIIGILASFTLVGLNSARARSRDASRKNDLAQIQKALELYALDNGGYYPAGAYCCNGRGIDHEKWNNDPNSDVTFDNDGLNSYPNIATKALLDGKYLAALPRPPRSGEFYSYGTNAQHWTALDENSSVVGVSKLGYKEKRDYVLEFVLERPADKCQPFWHVRSNGISSATKVPIWDTDRSTYVPSSCP